MTTRERILDFFEKHMGESVSGEKLAEELNLSRNAVWKSIKTLRKEGYVFDSLPGKGYSLIKSNEKLSTHSISKFLRNPDFFNISLFDILSSTNDYIKKAAESGASEGLVAIANEQSAGKGRMGRGFHSPYGSGVYMSILLRPDLPAIEAVFITTAAAVAVAKAITEVTGIITTIKWVNDIYIEGKKVCGILTEASLDFESSSVSYAVLGIGINIADPEEGFPEGISGIAASIFGANKFPPETKQRLIAAVLDNFYEYYKDLRAKKFMPEYRLLSCVISKDIYVFTTGSKLEAIALDIDDDSALIVKYKNGEIGRLNSGEISIRVKNNENQ